MLSSDIRQRFLDYFTQRDHTLIPSSSLIPTDPSTLLTTAGMQQLVPYLAGEEESPWGNKLCSTQKCFRTVDIEEVGDDTHNTFFEMLGNWSIGDYFKKKTIEMAYDFFVNELKLDPDKFHVTVFAGDDDIPADTESIDIWKEIGIPAERIYKFDKEDNLWIAGDTGPCGPSSEIHYDRGEKYGDDSVAVPNHESAQRVVEIWNLVFMEYFKREDGTYTPLPMKSVDTGIGFERLVSLMQDKSSVFETDLFTDIIDLIEELSGKKYSEYKKEFRIIADHLRATTFMIADGIRPGNLERDYVLRKIIRRSIGQAKKIDLPVEDLPQLITKYADKYSQQFPELADQQDEIIKIFNQEADQFATTLEKGLKEFNKRLPSVTTESSGEFAFNLLTTFGFPREMTTDLLAEQGIEFDEPGYRAAMQRHCELSRANTDIKFKGGLADETPKTIALHTTAHLMLQALRQVLGDHVVQKGQAITPERLRFDFAHDEKVTPEQIQEVEDLVNKQIEQDLPVSFEEMSVEEAENKGAIGVFGDRYGDCVKVYQVGGFSCEICGGPHVEQTGQLGHFKIIKEQSSSKGVRRIKAILEKD